MLKLNGPYEDDGSTFDVTSEPTSPDKQSGGFSDSDLLQANATVIAGVLIFLTVGSLGGILTGFKLLFAISIILIPFCFSSAVIVFFKGFMLPVQVQRRFREKTFKYISRYSSLLGFGYIIGVIFLISITSASSRTTAEDCAINPESYNITHVADCSKFTPGRIDQCTFNPGRFHVSLKQCVDFIK